MSDNILKNKNCVITGATGSLGTCISEELASRGCNLFLISKSENKLIELQGHIKKKYTDVEIFYNACDLLDINDIQRAINDVKLNFKSIDILINGAGIVQFAKLEDTSLEDFNEMFNINVRATFIFCKGFIGSMIRQNWGRIVNIGSKASYNGSAQSTLYCASKHAVLGFSRALLKEVAKHDVRVFCISPGAILSEMGKEVVKAHNLNPDTFMDPVEVAQYIIYAITFDHKMISEEVILSRFGEFI